MFQGIAEDKLKTMKPIKGKKCETYVEAYAALMRKFNKEFPKSIYPETRSRFEIYVGFEKN